MSRDPRSLDKTDKDQDDDVSDDGDDTAAEDSAIMDVEVTQDDEERVTPLHRRRFCCLALRLIQGPDPSLRRLVHILLKDSLPAKLISIWARHLKAVATVNNVHD